MFLLNLFLINIRGKCLLEFASFLQALGRAEGLKPKKKKKKNRTDTTNKSLLNYEYYSIRMIQTLTDFLHTELLRG